jgi:serine O-acetyltransferase
MLARGFFFGEPPLSRAPAMTPPMLRDLIRNSLRQVVSLGTPRARDVTDAPARRARAELPQSASDARAPAELGTLELLAEDFATYDRDLSQPGLWAVAAHRLGRRAAGVDALPLRLGLEAAYKVLFTGIDWVWGIHLPRSVELGRRVRLWHCGCMLLTARSIGNDVHIRHDTTFGPLRGTDAGPLTLPIIEDRADVGSGACVLGAVRVGHDAVVGANSVVMKNVPPHATVLGVPARIVPT